ncbi:MAG: L,D-transpeptidase [Clostridia bacterium]|nr:L,D-transpeptidase [Clostridia bacterium]
MKRLAVAAIMLLVLMVGIALGEGSGLSIDAPREEIRPGRPVILSFMVPEDGTCSIVLRNKAGAELTVAEERTVSTGYNSMYWNGTCEGIPVPEGDWFLTIWMNGQAAETPVTVGRMIPCLIAVTTENETVEEGDTVLISFYTTEGGTLLLQADGETDPLYWENVAAGTGEAGFQAEMEPGNHELTLTLAGEDGTLSEPVRLLLEVLEKEDPDAMPTPEPLPEYLREKAENGFTPAHTSPRRGEDQTLNYWTLPMDITDEEAVWKVLTAPITVLDNGKKNAEKMQVIIRSQPGEESDGIGMVTCISQGVHVLERGEEWSLIECYSSSFHDSPILNWNTLIQGYVPTAYLKEVKPNQEMGLVVDKLTQRLYVFRDGKLYSTLLVSTGISNAKQPYNETRSGEFMLVSKVGEFASDNLRCAMALRFNDGDLLHEVPYIAYDYGKDYSVNEPKLGTKASHGCIRVQRQPSPEGVNQRWLWTNYIKNTRILIWEDWQGRQLSVPDSETSLYCVKKRTGNYHTTDQCNAIRGKRVEELTYGQLDGDEYKKLKPCPLCAAPPRVETILAINETYAEGGDHDPVMTEARKNCPRKLKGK